MLLKLGYGITKSGGHTVMGDTSPYLLRADGVSFLLLSNAVDKLRRA